MKIAAINGNVEEVLHDLALEIFYKIFHKSAESRSFSLCLVALVSVVTRLIMLRKLPSELMGSCRTAGVNQCNSRSWPQSDTFFNKAHAWGVLFVGLAPGNLGLVLACCKSFKDG